MLETRTQKQSLTVVGRVELGVVGGVVSSAAMGVVLIIFAGIGFETPRFFTLLPEILGIYGPSYEQGLIGLVLHFIIGSVWGLVYAFAFKSYSVTKGLGLAAVQLILLAILLTNSIPGYGKSLVEIPVLEAAKILTVYGLSLATYGATLGLAAKKNHLG
jgi:hypothetical protein